MQLIAKNALYVKNLYTFEFILKTKNSYEENIVLTFIGGMAYMMKGNEPVTKNMLQYRVLFRRK